MIFVGIDPGLTGGIAAISDKGIPIFVSAFKPVDGEFDAYALADMITEIRAQHSSSTNRILCAVEKVHAMPKQGVSSTFKFGVTYGKILGLLSARLIPFELVTPQAWTKVMLAGEKKDDKKDRAKIVAQRLFPEMDLRASERSTTVHSGMADAILIAEFLRRNHVHGV